ncbi:MAG: hypothetical protein ACE5E0_00030 [Terriglobia bacterium]
MRARQAVATVAKSRDPRRRITVGLVVTLLLLGSVQAFSLTWAPETVDSAGSVGRLTSLAVDASGSPHISYGDDRVHLRYATKSGPTWVVETVDSGERVMVGGTSLALAGSGNPRIAYINNHGNLLKYASHDGTGWNVETVAVGPKFWVSLALDASGNPHISYFVVSGDLYYATNDGTGWTTVAVDDRGGDRGIDPSIAVDSSGRPHISYRDGVASALNYASFDGTGWTIEAVDTGGGQYSSLVLDSLGNPRISHYDWGANDLKYSSFDGAIWTTETVDATGDVGQFTSLALDPSGNPRISYYDATNQDLKFASRNGAGWTTETVDAIGDVGSDTSLALDGLGNPRMSYYDATNADLKYASGSASPEERIDDILVFFDSSVSSGDLVGTGPGASARGRLGALRNMIEEARDLAAAGDLAGACDQLRDAMSRVDGNPRPPDFATGAAASTLRGMIEDARAGLGCG